MLEFFRKAFAVKKTTLADTVTNHFEELASHIHAPMVFIELQSELDNAYLRRILSLNEDRRPEVDVVVSAYLSTRGVIDVSENIDHQLERMSRGWSEVVRLAAENDYRLPDRVDLRHYSDYKNQPLGAPRIKFFE